MKNLEKLLEQKSCAICTAFQRYIACINSMSGSKIAAKELCETAKFTKIEFSLFEITFKL